MLKYGKEQSLWKANRLGLRNETFAEWATSRKYKIMNTMLFQKKAWRIWVWKSPNSVTMTEIDYILTNRSHIVTDVTGINQVNTGSDRRLVMSNIKLDVEVEMEKHDDQEATKSGCHKNMIKEEQIPTRIDKPIRNTTRISRHRHRHHERNHHRHDPWKRVKCSQDSYQAT